MGERGILQFSMVGAVKIHSFLLLTILLAGCNTTLPNGCTVDAAYYQSALIAQHRVRESRLLFVQFEQCEGFRRTHCFCVFKSIAGRWYAYDSAIGSFPLRSDLTTEPLIVAAQLIRPETIVAAWYEEKL